MTVLRKERILEYLDNLDRQLSDLKAMEVEDADFFMNRKNFERTKAIKYTLACAIQDVTRIALHIVVAEGLARVRDSEADAILALSEAGIIPTELGDKIRGMPGFRNRLIHDYLPNEFDAARLFDRCRDLDDFRAFSKHVVTWIKDHE
jgi:uncharacterized protein YutE (UPF0331/DUF86 family)